MYKRQPADIGEVKEEITKAFRTVYQIMCNLGLKFVSHNEYFCQDKQIKTHTYRLDLFLLEKGWNDVFYSF